MHDRKKKAGQRKDKQTHAMREAVAERKEQAAPPRPTTDEGDVQPKDPQGNRQLGPVGDGRNS